MYIGKRQRTETYGGKKINLTFATLTLALGFKPLSPHPQCSWLLESCCLYFTNNTLQDIIDAV